MPLPIKKPLPDGRGSDWRIATLIGAATVRERFFLSKSPSLARKPQIRVVTAFDLAGCAGNEAMKKKPIDTPKFVNEAEEADWWASREGREFVKRKSVGPPKKGSDLKGSRLVGQLNRTSSVQIALRLPGPDVTKAREIATRKGIGYQTLLKMLVHEGLRREARRP